MVCYKNQPNQTKYLITEEKNVNQKIKYIDKNKHVCNLKKNFGEKENKIHTHWKETCDKTYRNDSVSVWNDYTAFYMSNAQGFETTSGPNNRLISLTSLRIWVCLFTSL